MLSWSVISFPVEKNKILIFFLTLIFLIPKVLKAKILFGCIIVFFLTTISPFLKSEPAILHG